MYFGIDEAGRGPVIGPLVIAIFGCSKLALQELNSLGVKDSKLLSAGKRKEIFQSLTNNPKYYFDYRVISPHEIDNYVDQSSLNYLEILYFGKLIKSIPIELLNDSQIMLDACESNTEKFTGKVRDTGNLGEDLNIKSENKADLNYLQVAAASIIAKEIREENLEQIKRTINLEIGSGYPSDPKTKAAVAYLTKEKIPNEHLRYSWSTTRNAYKLNHGLDLEKRPYKYGNQRTLF